MKSVKSIKLVELNEPNHSSLLESWIQSLAGYQINIEIITNSKVLTELNIHENVSIKVLDQKWKLLFWVFKQIWKNDLVILMTLQKHWLPLMILSLTNQTVITVHNANNWFLDRFPSNGTLKDRVKFHFRKIIFNRIEYMCVNSYNMLTYIKEKYGLVQKKIFVIPFSCSKLDNFGSQKLKQDIFITYPGRIEPERKEYDAFLKLAQLFPNEKFCLLGSIKNCADVKFRARALGNIIIFEDRVSKDIFENLLLRSKYLFSDFKPEVEVSGINEFYGKSKDSGLSYLSYKYNKKIITNDKFVNIFGLEDAVISYRSEKDLLMLAQGLCNETLRDSYPDFKLKPDYQALKSLLIEYGFL